MKELLYSLRDLLSGAIIFIIDGIILTITWNAIAWKFNLPTFPLWIGIGVIWSFRTLFPKTYKGKK